MSIYDVRTQLHMPDEDHWDDPTWYYPGWQAIPKGNNQWEIRAPDGWSRMYTSTHASDNSAQVLKAYLSGKEYFGLANENIDRRFREREWVSHNKVVLPSMHASAYAMRTSFSSQPLGFNLISRQGVLSALTGREVTLGDNGFFVAPVNADGYVQYIQAEPELQRRWGRMDKAYNLGKYSGYEAMAAPDPYARLDARGKPKFQLVPKSGPTQAPKNGATRTVDELIKEQAIQEVLNETFPTTETASIRDIANIDPNTGKPVGGISSYYEDPPEPDPFATPATPLPATPAIELDTKYPIGFKKKKRISVTYDHNIKNILEWRALQDKWQHSLSIQNVSAERMADAASIIAASQRIRLGAKLGSFDTVQEREDYLDVLHIDNPVIRREALQLGELEYARTHRGPVNDPYKMHSFGFAGGIRFSTIEGSGWQQKSFLYDIALGKTPYKQYENPEHLEEQMFMGIKTKAPVSGDNLKFNWKGFTGYSKLDDLRAEGVKKFDWNKLFEAFGKGLTMASTAFKAAAPVFQALSSVNQEWKQATFREAYEAYEAAEYFVPHRLKGASSRLFKSVMQSWGGEWDKEIYNKRATAQGLLGAAGILGGVATLNPVLIGGGIASTIESYGSWRTGRIKAAGQSIQSRINLWSGVSELILTPIRLIGDAFKWLTGHLKFFGIKLGSIIEQFSRLGLPLGALTGMSYSGMQRSYVMDAMIGASSGTSARGLEAFSYAQQSLYTYGQMDTSRVIAAAMLGSFGDIYAQGGNTQRQYANVLNRAYAQARANPADRQRIMNLLRVIDESMPSRLQQMLNLGGRFGDYNYISSGRWAEDYGITLHSLTPEQRNKMTIASMQYTGLKDSILSSRNILAERLWSGYGKNLMSGFNDIFADFARGKLDLPGALSRGWGMLRGTWNQLSTDFKLPEIGKNIAQSLWDAIPTISRIIGQIGGVIIQGWGQIGAGVMNVMNRIISDLSLTSIKVDFEKLITNFTTGRPIGEAIKITTPESIAEGWFGSSAEIEKLSRLERAGTIQEKYDELGDTYWLLHTPWTKGKKYGSWYALRKDASTISAWMEANKFTDFSDADKNALTKRYLSYQGVIPWKEEYGPLTGFDEMIKRSAESLARVITHVTGNVADQEWWKKGPPKIEFVFTDGRTGKQESMTYDLAKGTIEGTTPLSALGFDINDMMVKISAKGE